ncbi:glutamate receptor ionotropic, kainate 3-like [Pectinophora gossypiella]|uniref:glutamate receptor ionotropic, kainate 3-like n=1 Tax=Pectinophora gossypiella TaxID=13191 RepID=UPI00214F52B9|nr:glutamate receptor ionotropic, kainate 3-like [Pectinophora gossypiella]
MFTKAVFLVLITSQCVLSASQLVIGGLFYEDEAEDLAVALELSAELYNFTTSVKQVSRRGQILEISEHVCALAKEEVIGIIDGTGGRASEHVQALCDILELPHIIIEPNDFYSKNWTLLSLFPSPDAFNNALAELIDMKEWNNFTILYVKGHSLKLVENLMQMGNSSERATVSIRELSGDDYRDVLIEAKGQGYYNFVVDCPSKKLEQLLLHAQQVGLMADEHSYIFVSPDLFTLDLSRYRYGGVNMTGFRLVHVEEDPNLWQFTEQFNEKTGKGIEPEQLKTKVILVHDAVKVIYEAVKKVHDIQPKALDCEMYEAWPHGSSLLNFMRTNKVEGVTRTLLFDGQGQRNDVLFDILELTPAGNQTIGVWDGNVLIINRPFVPAPDISEDSIMRNKTFKVLIALTPPYAYIKESSEYLTGNDQYEGFAIDLIDELSKRLGFNYEFEVEPTYGNLDSSGKWTGMVAKIREDKAEFAICDLTITAERQKGMDFSTPFMTLGIGILYKEPSKQPPEMFSFMAVFAKDVWYYMMFVQMGIAVIMIFVGRISYKEWQNPVPCVESPEELSNQFSFANSVWLIIGSVMQQGSEIAPIALAPRMITSVWWFFTMVMVASYVGTLVAFLTVEKNVLPFNTVEELAAQKSIYYGAKSKGSTISFFKESNNEVYKKMYQKMLNNKGWLVDSNDEGVAIAENSTYAFFTESTSIEYYKERHCDLLQIGDLLDSKSYGIGMKTNSSYKKYIDDALLQLKESGEIQRLKDLWWKEKRGGGKCGEQKEEEAKQLGMKNMLGAFVVLGVGCVIGLGISILDMFWGVFKRSVKYKTTFKYELVEELKFALKFSGDVKPVKRPPKTADGSEEALNEEAKDELGSLKSARTIHSGRSTSTKRSSHSHCSRHSPSDLSVAFAKRRQYNSSSSS